ncbi:MAG: hypothetical protein ACKOQW_02180, partial [Phycisphaerales bacterium]
LAAVLAMQSSTGVPPGAATGSASQAASSTALVGTENAATDAMAALRREIDALGREPASATRDARMALRRTAFDLLFHGGTDLGAQVGPVAGLRLAALRTEVDARLSMPRREGLAPAAVDAPLARFAAAAAVIVPGPMLDGPSPEVVGAIGHLVGALALMEGDATPPDPWPTTAALGRMASGTAEDARPGDAAAPDAAAARARIAAIDVRTLRADARSRATDLVRSAGRAPSDAEVAAIDADRRRLQALPAWVDAAAAAKASLRSRFDATTRAWVKSLHEPTRRATAREALARFESERAMVGEFPLEAALRRGDPVAAARTAGRAADVLAAIDRARAAWFEGWLDGRGNAARTAVVMRLARALSAVEEATPRVTPAPDGADAEGNPAAWGGWPWIADAPRVPAKGLAARAELALAAVLEGDDAAADRQLATLDLELPPATLERMLRERLASWGRGRSGLAHRLAASVASPGPGAWLGGRRAELSAVARLLAEASRARARDDLPLLEALRREIAARAAPIASAP